MRTSPSGGFPPPRCSCSPASPAGSPRPWSPWRCCSWCSSRPVPTRSPGSRRPPSASPWPSMAPCSAGSPTAAARAWCCSPRPRLTRCCSRCWPPSSWAVRRPRSCSPPRPPPARAPRWCPAPSARCGRGSTRGSAPPPTRWTPPSPSWSSSPARRRSPSSPCWPPRRSPSPSPACWPSPARSASPPPRRCAAGARRRPPRAGLLATVLTPGMPRMLLSGSALMLGFGALEVAIPAFADGGRRARPVRRAARRLVAGLGRRRPLVRRPGAVSASLPRQYRWGLLGVTIGLAPLAVVSSPWVLAALLFLGGTAIAPTLTVQNNLVGSIAPAHATTEAFTWLSTDRVRRLRGRCRPRRRADRELARASPARWCSPRSVRRSRWRSRWSPDAVRGRQRRGRRADAPRERRRGLTPRGSRPGWRVREPARAAGSLRSRRYGGTRPQEASPSPVYGAALLMRFGLIPIPGSNPGASAPIRTPVRRHVRAQSTCSGS